MHRKFDYGIVCYHIVNENSLVLHTLKIESKAYHYENKKNHGDFHLNCVLTELTSDLFHLVRYSKLCSITLCKKHYEFKAINPHAEPTKVNKLLDFL